MPESFNQALDGKNVFSLQFVDGTCFSNQLEGLGDGCRHVCDRLNIEFSSVTII